MPTRWHWRYWEYDPRASVGFLRVEGLDMAYAPEVDDGGVSCLLVVFEKGWVRLKESAVTTPQMREVSLGQRVEVLHLANGGCCPDWAAALF